MSDQHDAKFGDIFRLIDRGDDDLVVMVIGSRGTDYKTVTLLTDVGERPFIDTWGLFRSQWAKVE